MSEKAVSNFFIFIQRNYVTVLILLLFLIYSTGTIYNYLRFLPDTGIPSTESRLNAAFANDFYTSVYFRASQMLKGEEMNVLVIHPGYVDSATGQLFPLLFSPFLFFLKPDRYTSYFFFLGLIAVIFIFFYALLMKKSDKHMLNAGLIFLVAFFLSEPGFLGIYMGNTDIILAPIMGILILFVLNSIRKKSVSLIWIILLGILAGALMNAKIFLFPFTILSVFFSKRSIMTGVISAVTFLALVYIPNFFGSQSSLLLFFNKIVSWNDFIPFSNHLWANHSLYAITSLFAGCVESNSCNMQIESTSIILLLFFFTFVMPFFLYNPLKKIVINRNPFLVFQKLRENKEFAVVLFVIVVAFINLAFKVIYDYRLFYSLIVTLILLKECALSKRALVYCYLSMFSLLLGGIWALRLIPNEPWTIDARLLKFFIVFHFFFLILSALIYWKESQEKATKTIQHSSFLR